MKRSLKPGQCGLAFLVFYAYETVKDFLKNFKKKNRKYMLTNNIIWHIV
jgi:hypothetical protein